MSLRIAFSGTGHISRVHARAAQSVDGLRAGRLWSITAPSRWRTTRRNSASRGNTRQLEDLLRDGELDALVVSTPNYLHAPQTIAALEAGVHVMVEKPMALNGAEAEAMLRASENSGAKLMVAHCWRFDEEVNWIKSAN